VAELDRRRRLDSSIGDLFLEHRLHRQFGADLLRSPLTLPAARLLEFFEEACRLAVIGFEKGTESSSALDDLLLFRVIVSSAGPRAHGRRCQSSEQNS
jgi:hypothetical protein